MALSKEFRSISGFPGERYFRVDSHLYKSVDSTGWYQIDKDALWNFMISDVVSCSFLMFTCCCFFYICIYTIYGTSVALN